MLSGHRQELNADIIKRIRTGTRYNQLVGPLTSRGPDPDISGFETSGHIDHEMSSPVVRLAMIVRLADSLIICCHFKTILTVFL